MRRRYIYIDGGATTSGGGGGGLQQTVQVDLGDGTWDTPTYSDWFRYCYNESLTVNNVTNTTGANTGWSITKSASSNGESEGPTGSTTTGYPVGVTQYGNCNSSNTTYTFTNLNNSYTYTFELWGSTIGRTYENPLGQTIWTIGATSVSIYHRNYYGNPVTISSVSPSSGSIVVSVAKDVTYANNWYWCACVIKEYN